MINIDETFARRARRGIDAMKFERPLKVISVRTVQPRVLAFAALYFQMVPSGSVSDKWTFSSLECTANKERHEQRLSQDIRSREYGRSAWNGFAPRSYLCTNQNSFRPKFVLIAKSRVTICAQSFYRLKNFTVYN